MKFGDKLVALRKKNGLSQEDLAAKLNVSRQSVSKWESNNTYPETDKIVQICNIFDCSMDDLINEKITNLEQVERKDKTSVSIYIDSFLEFITNTVNMFAAMSFKSGLKCLVEMGIVFLVLAFGGVVIVEVLSGLIASLFEFIPNAYYLIDNILWSVFMIIWFIVAVIIFIHIFKIRYLDYYEEMIKKKSVVKDIEEKNDSNKNKEDKFEKKDRKINFSKKQEIIIRDGKGALTFLNVLSKIVVGFIKFFAMFFLFGALMFFAGEIALGVVFIPFAFASMIFIGINIAVLGTIIITLSVILVLFNFIFKRKINVKIVSISILVSTVLIGIGSGLGFLGIKDITVIDQVNSDLKGVYKEELNYHDGMYFSNHNYFSNDAYSFIYKVDDNIETNKIKVETNYDDRFYTIDYSIDYQDNMEGYSFNSNFNLDFNKAYKTIIKDLKNNKIRNFSSTLGGNLIISANQVTIDRLFKNLDKMYIYEKVEVADGIKVTNMDFKVIIENDSCGVNYDAKKEELVIREDNCSCISSTEETSRGTRVKYNCSYIQNDSYNN